MELRTRVLTEADGGWSSKALAERYHMSRTWVDALKQRRRETGRFGPRKQTIFRRRALAPVDADRLAALASRDRMRLSPNSATPFGRRSD